MVADFFRETYPIVLLYAYFLFAVLGGFLAWLEIGGSPDETFKFLSEGHLNGRRAGVMYVYLQVIAELSLLYGLSIMTVFGILPVYLMLSHGYVKYKTAFYILLGLYALWVAEKIIRMIVLKFFPKKSKE